MPRKYSEEEIKDILINGNVEIAKTAECSYHPSCTVCQKPRDAKLVTHRPQGVCESCYKFHRRNKHQKLKSCPKNCTIDYSCTRMCFHCRYQKCLTVGLGLNSWTKLQEMTRGKRRRITEEEIPEKKPRFTPSIGSQTDSSSDEESEQKCEVDIESEFKRRRLSIAAVIAEKEHKFMVSYFH